MSIYLAYIVSILIAVLHARRTTLSFQDGFKALGMIPRFIETPPNATCQVIYPFGRLKPGSYLMPNQVKAIPKVTWPIESKKFYTLFMAGMEEPYVEEYDHYQADIPEIRLREWEQWVVINIPGRNVEKGLTLYEYITPHPAWKNNTSNRYAFFIFKQQYKIVEYMKADSEGFAYMETVSVAKFISDHNLGDPICGDRYQKIKTLKIVTGSLVRFYKLYIRVIIDGGILDPVSNTDIEHLDHGSALPLLIDNWHELYPSPWKVVKDCLGSSIKSLFGQDVSSATKLYSQ